MSYSAKYIETMWPPEPRPHWGHMEQGCWSGDTSPLVSTMPSHTLKEEGPARQNLNWFCFPSQRAAVSSNHNSTFHFPRGVFSEMVVLRRGCTWESPGEVFKQSDLMGLGWRVFLKFVFWLILTCTQSWILMLAIIGWSSIFCSSPPLKCYILVPYLIKLRLFQLIGFFAFLVLIISTCWQKANKPQELDYNSQENQHLHIRQGKLVKIGKKEKFRGTGPGGKTTSWHYRDTELLPSSFWS